MHLHLDLVDLVADQAGGMSGIAVGEVFRRTFDGDGPRFELQALVGGGPRRRRRVDSLPFRSRIATLGR